jgi:hypothetical protein
MARNFVAASSQYLEYAGAVRTAFPLTLVGWYRLASTAASQTLLSIDTNGGVNVATLLATGATGLVQSYAEKNGGGSAYLNAGTAVFTAGNWGHVAGVFNGGDFRVYFNGALADSSASASPTDISGADRTHVGVHYYGPGLFDYLDGDAAEQAVYSAALTAADIAQLAAGASPLLVRPESLVSCWQLTGRASPEPDLVGDFPLTLLNTPVYADHPRVYQAAGPLTLGVPGGAVASPVPRLMASYRRRRAG